MPLITTPGAPDANSYVSVLEASGYFSLSYNRTAWADASNSDKEKSLAEATRLLDTFVSWFGSIVSTTQSLRWPRKGVISIDGQNVASNFIPVGIKNLTCELAYNILQSKGFNIEENTIDKIRVGPINVDFDTQQKSNGFTKIVRDSIALWGTLNLGSSSGIKTVQLIRT